MPDLTPETLAEWRNDANEAHYYGGNEQVQAERIRALIDSLEATRAEAGLMKLELQMTRAQLATAKADALTEVERRLEREERTFVGPVRRGFRLALGSVHKYAEGVRRDATS